MADSIASVMGTAMNSCSRSSASPVTQDVNSNINSTAVRVSNVCSGKNFISNDFIGDDFNGGEFSDDDLRAGGDFSGDDFASSDFDSCDCVGNVRVSGVCVSGDWEV